MADHSEHQVANINFEKLNRLCLKKHIWDHFNITRAEFFELCDPKQQDLISRFYFDHFDDLHSNDYFTICETIKNSKEVSDDASNKTEKRFKSACYQHKSTCIEDKKHLNQPCWHNDFHKNLLFLVL